MRPTGTSRAARAAPALVATALLVLAALLVRAQPATGAPREPAVPGGGWPLAGVPRVVRPFVAPAHRYGPGHRGVDLAGRVGTPVLAALPGRVAFAGLVAGRGVVSVDTGGLRTTYEPVAAQVRAGAVVGVGDPLGVLTAGSHCREPCLHWGLRSGPDYLDPLRTLRSADSVALVPADRRDRVAADAAERARLAEAATAGLGAGWVAAPGGRHGFARPAGGPVTSPFGLRLHPVLHVWKLHDGTDLGAACGAPVRAPADGRVVAVGPAGGYGNRLLLEHGRVDGVVVRTGYAHAAGYVVRPGQQVVRGQLLGRVGSTGYATGCHLHLQVWLDGRLADPSRWFTL
ncbi:Peptidase family M23 [Friedmanniella luteola]|uniref:Peptidase family M23 n=1 Tax=Friedmanniella luteola TaxID=546871 RepID=A0A1H1PUL9_9ACTN|nr:peptidoglycan DD-metalloendopeptidase family protein [Friedmanniella luteola]SDS14816.1 Peptidase family M23 [Friedmanniella luteola]